MADAAPILMWASGPGKEAIWFNKRWTDFVGHSLAQALAAGWTAHVHPEDRERSVLAYAAHVDTRTDFSIEYRLRRHDGTYCLVRNTGAPLHAPDGSFAGYISTCIDLGEEKRALSTHIEGADAIQIMTDSAPVMLWMSNTQGICVHLNRKLREFWGLPPDGLANFDWSQNLHPDDVDRVAEAVQQSLSDRSPLALQLRLRNHRGEYRIIRTKAQPHYSSAGEFLGLIGVNIDITEEARANQALHQSEERFASFMHHLPGLAWIKDMEGRYVFANEAATRAFGVPRDELIGHTDHDLFPPETANQFRENDLRALHEPGGARAIEVLRHPDGGLHHSIVSKFVIPGSDGGSTMTGGVAIDVSDHKAAEHMITVLNEDLKNKLEEQEALLGALPVGVLIARDADCREILTNKAAAQMLSLPEGGNASKSGPNGNQLPFRVFSGGRELDTSELPMQKCARTGIPIHGQEVDLVFNDGRTKALHESISPLFDTAGRVRGCVAVFVDITERKQIERQKSLFIDELNHRVKNTLAIVQAIASQTLRQTVDPKAFNTAFIGRLDALSRAHSLLTTSLWEGVDLADLVAVALTPFENFKGQVTVDGPSIVIRPNGAVTLSLVLHELATNAVKYGAFSTATGKVAISWLNDGTTITLRWSEVGGPAVGEPAHKGFGSRLIAASAAQLGGTANVTYARSGLKASLVFPVRERTQD